jgi:hypothetical protein
MNTEILLRNSGKRAFLEAATALFIKELKLEKFKHKLLISTKKNLIAEEGARGMASKLPDNTLVVILDSRLDIEKMVETLAHEMVHIKQLASGKLQWKYIRGKETPFWLGKKVVASYYNRPWEIQAWSQQMVLANKLWAVINQ